MHWTGAEPLYNYYTMEETSLEDLHAAFIAAFSDYHVKMDLPLWRLESMLRRRGYVPRLSMGAFERGVLVGFLLNGIRKWQGALTAYDTGTGVVPDHRDRGITKRMFKEISRTLREEGVRRYLLEVIKENRPAVHLYQGQGFKATRGLSCYALERKRLPPGPGTDLVLKEVPVRGLDWKLASTFWDYQPTWQNSKDSLLAAATELACVAALGEDGAMVGYGVIEPRTGDIPQLAVRWDYRDQGVGRAILDALVEGCEAPRLAVVNVEEAAPRPRGFLERLGFELFTEQHEMVLDL